MEEIQNMQMNRISLKRLYHINASSINMLQRLASVNGTKRTKIEAFSAYVWRIMIGTIDESHKKCKMVVGGGWKRENGPGLMLAKAVLGQDGPALVVSSGQRFPVSEVDFGFGSPLLGTVYTSIEGVGVGYMNQRPSAKGDGSWTVSAILWPELAAALKDDPIFQPMTASHLQL
ncbi:Transferase [Sesbania bispinosa]|nr:Transferase [Sesbania bispinosa]